MTTTVRNSIPQMRTEMLPAFVRDCPRSEYNIECSLSLIGHVNADHFCNCEPGTLLLRVAAYQTGDYVREIITLEYHSERWGVFRCKGPNGSRDVSVFPAVEFATLGLITRSPWPQR